jgi:DNA-directed RNA polymerase subunit RPC12/RpoP
MSDFKFACPSCGQRIAATDEYVGQYINCPACQKEIVVPANPATPSSLAINVPGALPPPAPPKVTRLGVAGLSHSQPHASSAAPTAEQQGSAAFRAHMARQPKKSYTGLISGVAAVLLIGLSAYLNKDTLKAKWKSFHKTPAEEFAAQFAATNQPPPKPTEMTASEIMQKVVEVYRDLPSFGSTGKATAILDMSAVNPVLAANGPVTVSSDLALKMSKPLSFRIDMTTPTALTNITVTCWSTGNGYFIQANNRRVSMPSRDLLFSSLNTSASVSEIVLLFIDDASEGLAKPGIEWTRNKDETLGGEPCYVLAGTVNLQKVLVWVSKKSFLIPQTKIVLDGKSNAADMDDAKIKEALKAQNRGVEPTLLQIANFKKMLKTTGTVTETYGGIQTNLTLAMSDIQPPAPVAPARAAGPAQGAGGYDPYGGGTGPNGGGGGRGGGRGGGGRGR